MVQISGEGGLWGAACSGPPKVGDPQQEEDKEDETAGEAVPLEEFHDPRGSGVGLYLTGGRSPRLEEPPRLVGSLWGAGGTEC